MTNDFRDAADTAQSAAPAAESVVGTGAESAGRDSGGWLSMWVYGVLPALILLLALGAGAVKWMDGERSAVETARTEALRAATDGTIAMLSYHSETVEDDLTTVRDLLTGTFRDSYISLTEEVVIPGSKEQSISSEATVPAAAVVSATADNAVILVFINQATVVGDDAPTNLISTARVTLDKVEGRWLISEFEPV